MKLQPIKYAIEVLGRIRYDLETDSRSPLPSRDLIRHNLCEIDFIIEGLKEFIIENVE